MMVSTLIGLECSLPPLLDFWKNNVKSCKCATESGRKSRNERTRTCTVLKVKIIEALRSG